MNEINARNKLRVASLRRALSSAPGPGRSARVLSDICSQQNPGMLPFTFLYTTYMCNDVSTNNWFRESIEYKGMFVI